MAGERGTHRVCFSAVERRMLDKLVHECEGKLSPTWTTREIYSQHREREQLDSQRTQQLY